MKRNAKYGRTDLLAIGWLLVASILNISSLYGQSAQYARNYKQINKIVDNWVWGEVTFKDGETVRCEFAYNPLVPEGLLKIKDESKVTTMTAFNVERFTFYDDTTQYTYYSLPIVRRNRAFAQLLYEGPRYALLGRKSAQVYSETSDLINGIILPKSKVKLNYQRVLFDFKNGNSYVISRKELLWHLSDKKKEIKAFIRANRLKFKDNESYIQVMQEYERLTQ